MSNLMDPAELATAGCRDRGAPQPARHLPQVLAPLAGRRWKRLLRNDAVHHERTSADLSSTWWYSAIGVTPSASATARMVKPSAPSVSATRNAAPPIRSVSSSAMGNRAVVRDIANAIRCPGRARLTRGAPDEGDDDDRCADRLEGPDVQDAFIDMDEWRDAPVRHRYVHGGLRGRRDPLLVLLPARRAVRGSLLPSGAADVGHRVRGDDRRASTASGSIEFAVDSGAYLVESNMVAPHRFRATTGRWRATARARPSPRSRGWSRPRCTASTGRTGTCSAAAAAAEDGSCIENTVDVWDGGCRSSWAPSMACRTCSPCKRTQCACSGTSSPASSTRSNPAVSGDMYAGLTTEEREALAEVTRYGFPPRWFDVERLARGYTGVWWVMADNLVSGIPATSRTSGRCRVSRHGPARVVGGGCSTRPPRRRVVRRGSKAARTAHAHGDAARYDHRRHRRRLRVADLPDANLLGATLTITSGRAADHAVYIVGIQDDLVITGVGEANVDGLLASRPATRSSSTTRCTSRSRPSTVTTCTPTSRCGTSTASPASPCTRGGPTRSGRAAAGSGSTTPAGSRGR